LFFGLAGYPRIVVVLSGDSADAAATRAANVLMGAYEFESGAGSIS
jgi:hypothetical protein